jgi:uncharacterized protein (TIGR02246 family)
MRSSLLLMVLAFAACRAGGRSAIAAHSSSDTADPGSGISAQLARSASDWNRGDLEGFLSDYAAESTTTFVDGFRPRRGIEFIRENYAPRFSPGARRDSLRFEEIETRSLTPTIALVTARYSLHRGDSVTSSGPFTLVMERRAEGWRILHDHTSSDPR